MHDASMLRPERALSVLFLLLVSAMSGAAPSAADDLLQRFRQPPPAARPQVWWHWMNGNVNLDAAKLDLAWMQRVGVGGVHTFTGGGLGGPHVVDPPVEFMGDAWRATFRETTRIARAAGMEVTIAGSPGWSETGGTWVAPSDAMKKYVWSETQLRGGKLFEGTLSLPPSATGPFLGVARGRNPPARELAGDWYRDSMVVAFPTPPADIVGAAPAFRTDSGFLDLSALQKGDLAAAVSIPIPEGSRSRWIEATFERPTTLAALTLGLSAVAEVEIQAGEDGSTLHTLLKAPADSSEVPAPEQTYAFAPTRARVFRIILTLPPVKPLPPNLPARLMKPPPIPRSFSLTRLALCGGARVNRFESKAGFQAAIDADAPATPPAAADAVIPFGRVIDLTAKMAPDGKLRWRAPPGQWTVLRFGWSLTGQTNGPAEAKDTGLEVDKLNPSAVHDYIEHYLSLYREAMQEDLGAANVQSLLTDSWEAGVQNWTPTLLDEFKTRRGYDPLPYLPVLVGRIVADASSSERFLWDFHRTLEEALADNHYGVIERVLHEHGMNYYTEAQGDTPRAIGDGMTIKSRSDIPTAEYWYRAFATKPGQPSLKADLREAASAAHVYGKPLAAAESLTVAAGTDPWAFSPRMLKPVIDEIFANGINRILLHESHHQPLVQGAPGLTMGFFGQFFNRNDTWAEEAGSWIDYMSRSSFLLQQGKFVADVAYFYGEDRNLTELYLDRFSREVPEGYGYDYINPEALLTLLSVQDGSLVTPSGMRYRVLYVPPTVTRYTLPAIRKLRDLVADGAVLVAHRPLGGLGIQSSDAEMLAIADQLWSAGGSSAGARMFGKGRVYDVADLSAVLTAEGIAPDVAIGGTCAEDCQLLSVHRRTDDADIYFLSNRRNAARDLPVTFRVGNKIPELWRAENGSAEALSYQLTEHGVHLVLPLAADDAVFVVFRHDAIEARKTIRQPVSRELAAVKGPWRIQFQAGRGAPGEAAFAHLADWSASSDPGIKYFSGSATYSTRMQIPAGWVESASHLALDLGDVRELAVVRLDGKALGTYWHAPFLIDLPAGLAGGTHLLEIQVDNLWVNRLIGDKQPGAAPVAYAPQSPYAADSPLQPSGLLGPVRILAR